MRDHETEPSVPLPPGEAELKRLLGELILLIGAEQQMVPPPPSVHELVARCATCAREGYIPAERFIAQLKDALRRATPGLSSSERAEQTQSVVLWAIQSYYRSD